MQVSIHSFGKTHDNIPVLQFRMENNQGAYVNVLNYGCTIQSIFVPNRTGSLTDVCLGYRTVAEYEENEGYLGAVIGRHGNRIGDGKFEIDGKTYQLAKNDPPNHLHGGIRGFDKCVWDYELVEDGLKFYRLSPDGEEGYPGNLQVEVIYSFTDDNELIMEYRAQSDADTVLNMTNHTYFNLSGEGCGTILKHQLQLNASGFAENDMHCLPTGKTLAVEGTPFDFRDAKYIGKEIESENIQLKNGKGYDHNYVLDDAAQMKLAAELFSEDSGIRMTVHTTKPCIQLYTGNVLTGALGKSGKQYRKRAAVCLETQFYPNAMACNITPSPILKKEEHYFHKTVYQFDTL